MKVNSILSLLFNNSNNITYTSQPYKLLCENTKIRNNTTISNYSKTILETDYEIFNSIQF